MKVFLGEPVEVPLKGLSRTGLQLQFLIRRPPASGQLSEITLTGRGTAIVTYTPNAGAGTGVDRFRYAVRGPTGGVSTPVDVTLNVVERPAVFTAPARLDFPATAVGKSAPQTFEIRNDGGSRLEGHLTVPAPWKLSGDGDYALGPGDSKSFVVTFAPGDPRRFSDVGTFSHAEGVEIGLSGLGYAPIEVVPREIRLEGDGRSEVRTGGFLVRNVSDEDQDLVITAPGEIIAPASVKVAAKSEVRVALHTRKGFLGALDGWLKLSGREVRLDAPLRVMAAPARVRIEPGKIDLGSFVAGRFGRAKLTLRNDGGSPAALRVRLPDGVQLRPDPSYEALEVGQAREFEVSFARPGAGKLDDAMVFEAGGAPIAVAIKAVVTDDPRSDDSPGGPKAAPDATPKVDMNDIPPVPQIGMVQTKTSLELSWKKTSPDAVRYALFMRSIGFDDKGEPVFKYTALPRVKPRIIRDEVRATLEGLRPGERITLMVVSYDAAGKPSLPSLPFVVATEADPPRAIPWFWLGLATIAIFGWLLVRERRRQRAVTVEEIGRIYRS